MIFGRLSLWLAEKASAASARLIEIAIVFVLVAAVPLGCIWFGMHIQSGRDALAAAKLVDSLRAEREAADAKQLSVTRQIESENAHQSEVIASVPTADVDRRIADRVCPSSVRHARAAAIKPVPAEPARQPADAPAPADPADRPTDSAAGDASPEAADEASPESGAVAAEPLDRDASNDSRTLGDDIKACALNAQQLDDLQAAVRANSGAPAN